MSGPSGIVPFNTRIGKTIGDLKVSVTAGIANLNSPQTSTPYRVRAVNGRNLAANIARRRMTVEIHRCVIMFAASFPVL